jgi:hypothetical protein
MHIDPALLTPVALLLGSLSEVVPRCLAPFTRNAPKIAFSASHPRSRNGRPFMLISS